MGFQNSALGAFKPFIFIIFLTALAACKGDVTTGEHVTSSDNIFAASPNWYVQQPWSEKVIEEGHAAIAQHSTAIWLETLGDVDPDYDLSQEFGPGYTHLDLLRRPLREHLQAAVDQHNALVLITLYGLPGKKCAAVSSLGQLPANMRGMQVYKERYIERISEIFNEFPQLPIALILEPYSLPNLVKYHADDPCRETSNQHSWGYTNGIRYAINTLSEHQNVHIYLDIGASNKFGSEDDFTFATRFVHGVITGFDDTLKAAAMGEVELFAAEGTSTSHYQNIADDFIEPPTIAGMNTSPPGYGKIDGFVSNVNDYVPINEPYLGNPMLPEGSSPLRSAVFYEWNPRFDEWTYTRDWLHRITELDASSLVEGEPSRTGHLGIIIDTSRNGWGQAHRRLHQAHKIQDPLLVDEYRIDQRAHRQNWCNIAGGLGKRPQPSPDEMPWIDAYVWVNQIGKSQQASDPNYETTVDWPNYHHDPMCDPEQLSALGQQSEVTADLNLGTDAMADAPRDWSWFSDGMSALVDNAWPPICEGLNDQC